MLKCSTTWSLLTNMAELDYYWIGWCHEDNHDKVWGVISLDGRNRHSHYLAGDYLIFWGRRGKKLRTDVVRKGRHEIDSAITNKQVVKHYQRVDHLRLNEVYPEFQQDLEQSAVWAMLSQ